MFGSRNTGLVLAAIAMLWLNLSGSGCDLFRTRPTQPPLDTGSPWKPPYSAAQVLLNMNQALTEMNAQNYLRSFFGPDDGDLGFLFKPNSNAGGWPLSTPWGYAEESQTIQYLFTIMMPDDPPFLVFGEGTEFTFGNLDSVRLTRPYNLQVHTSDPTLPQEVSGVSDFYLAPTSTGYWAIYRWEDIEGYPSWTDLKAGLY